MNKTKKLFAYALVGAIAVLVTLVLKVVSMIGKKMYKKLGSVVGATVIALFMSAGSTYMVIKSVEIGLFKTFFLLAPAISYLAAFIYITAIISSVVFGSYRAPKFLEVFSFCAVVMNKFGLNITSPKQENTNIKSQTTRNSHSSKNYTKKSQTQPAIQTQSNLQFTTKKPSNSNVITLTPNNKKNTQPTASNNQSSQPFTTRRTN